MGTKMAPAYANLLMGKLDKELQKIDKPHNYTGNDSLMTYLSSGLDLKQNSKHK